MARNTNPALSKLSTNDLEESRPNESKESGYQKLSMLMGKAPEIAIFRSFKELNTITLLRLQAELQDMEGQLEDIRNEDHTSGDSIRRDYTKSFALMRDCLEDGDREQHDLLVDIGNKLKEYNAALSQARELCNFPAPSRRSVKFLRNWLFHRSMGDKFLTARESLTWEPENEADLVTIHDRNLSNDLFFSFLSGPIIEFYHRIWGEKRSRQNLDLSHLGPGIRRYDDRYLVATGHIVSVTLSSLLPTIAILILYIVKPIFTRIGLVIVFTAMFSMALAILTSAKRIEIFSATAAFAAVEVVFIGSVSND